LEEVLHRKVYPNMTRFKEMTMDEQIEMIEKINQEALGIREKNRAVEEVEAWRRGVLLLEEGERAIESFGKNPPLNPLIEPLRIT
jgi:hypothetical protein